MEQYVLHISEAKTEVRCCVDMLKMEQLAAKYRSNFIPWDCQFTEPKIFDYSLIRNCFHISRLS